jgi:WD40 repeat protein
VKYSKSIDIWKTDAISGTKNSGDDDSNNQGVQLDSRINIRGPHFIQSFALSSSGSMIAVSNAEGTRLWFLAGGKTSEDSIRPVDLPEVLASQTCTMLRFSADDKSLVAAFSAGDRGNHLCLLDVQWPSDGSMLAVSQATPAKSSKKKQRSNDGLPVASPNPTDKGACRALPTVTVRHVFNHSRSVKEVALGMKKSAAGTPLYKSKIINDLENICTSCSISADGQWLAVASGGTRVYIYEIDRLKLHWALPAFSSPVSSVTFHPIALSSVVVTLADNTFWMFDASSMAVAPWSAQYTDKIPTAVKSIPGPVEGATFDVNRPSHIILYGQGFLVFVDLNEAIPDAPKRVTPMNASVNIHRRAHFKRKNSNSSALSNNGTHVNRNFAIVSTYRSLVHVGCTAASHLVVLENPWVQVLDGLPDTLARERYGT